MSRTSRPLLRVGSATVWILAIKILYSDLIIPDYEDSHIKQAYFRRTFDFNYVEKERYTPTLSLWNLLINFTEVFCF